MSFPHQIKVNGCFVFVAYYSGNCFFTRGSYERYVFKQINHQKFAKKLKWQRIYQGKLHMGVEPKIMGGPQIIHLIHRVWNHHFHHPFWGVFPPLFLETSIYPTKLGGGFKYFYFHPYLGKIPILTNIFQMGWNHQLERKGSISCHVISIFCSPKLRSRWINFSWVP